MRRSTCCVLVELFGSWLSSFGQSAPKFTTPQIVATFQRLNQTGEIPPTTIYTPKNCGTFRKCQSKHTVDRLNLQPAVRSGQITAGWPVIPGCDRQSFADLPEFIWLSSGREGQAGPRRQPGKRSGA